MQIALIGAGSRSFGIYNSGDPEVFKDTIIMDSTPYIKLLMDDLCTHTRTKFLKIRIMKVLAGKAVAEHVDGFQADECS